MNNALEVMAAAARDKEAIDNIPSFCVGFTLGVRACEIVPEWAVAVIRQEEARGIPCLTEDALLEAAALFPVDMEAGR